ncbi:MAG: Yip1 family protein [Panacagrimonas sp.]
MSNRVERVKRILLVPRDEWPVIAAETGTASSLYTRYVMLLAAIPAVAGFIKYSLIGTGIPLMGTTVRIGVVAGLTTQSLQYVLSLVSVYVLALIVNALAPTFGGQKDTMQSLKVVAYAYTASWVTGAAVIIPWIGWLLGLAGGAYSVYLLYLGLPVTMRTAPDKSMAYTVVTILCAFVLSIAITFVVGAIGGGAAMNSIVRDGAGDIEITSDDGTVKIEGDSVFGQMAQQMEKAGKKMEAAQKSGDTQAQGEALGEVMGALLSAGGEKVDALKPEQIRPFVPETLGGLARTRYNLERNSMMGIQVANGTASYADDSGERSLDLEITDMGGARGITLLADWAAVESERESSEGYERVYQKDGMRVHEKWNGESRSGSYGLIVAERFLVKLEGNGLEMDEIKEAAKALDLSGLAKLKNEGAAPG